MKFATTLRVMILLVTLFSGTALASISYVLSSKTQTADAND